MNFKNYFLYQTDYQHWANDMLFSALDRLDDASRSAPQALFFGTVQDSVDHLAFFFRKWGSRLRQEPFSESYSSKHQGNWQEIKNSLRHEIRTMQHWLEQQPDDFYLQRITYKRTLNHEDKGVWVHDALTHMFTYASLERGHISAAASALGAPYPDMAYYTYRTEMGEHLDHLRKGDQ